MADRAHIEDKRNQFTSLSMRIKWTIAFTVFSPCAMVTNQTDYHLVNYKITSFDFNWFLDGFFNSNDGFISLLCMSEIG